jgi:hypothetical protein
LKDKFDHLANDIGGSLKRFFGNDEPDRHSGDAGYGDPEE